MYRVAADCPLPTVKDLKHWLFKCIVLVQTYMNRKLLCKSRPTTSASVPSKTSMPSSNNITECTDLGMNNRKYRRLRDITKIAAHYDPRTTADVTPPIATISSL